MCVNALSGCYLISTEAYGDVIDIPFARVNALSGCYLISTGLTSICRVSGEGVSMPSRAVTSFLPNASVAMNLLLNKCQCPLGLLPHFYR